MAEVFKAKSYGVEGFEKIIAIKRILPSMGEDRDFIKMFIDEAKIVGQLAHANICQIFELGRIDGTHFIAMEYIWGKDVLQIQNRLRKLGQAVPVPMACHIISKVCEGLDYAHRKRDPMGKPIEIVHRDCSPQNVLISYEGEVKIIDFGIAKAASRSSRTLAGVLKGKFGYMSPEQVRGLPLDRRSDIFALGTVLYEVLTGERLFQAESDFSTLEKVRNVDVAPPRSVNPDIPEEVESIVMKALAGDPDQRYQWCSEMHADLQRFLMSQETVFTSKMLSAWMKDTFDTELMRERRLMEEYKKVGRDGLAIEQPAEELEEEAPPEVAESLLDDGPTDGEATVLGGPNFEDILGSPSQEPAQELEAELVEDATDFAEEAPTEIFKDAKQELAGAKNAGNDPSHARTLLQPSGSAMAQGEPRGPSRVLPVQPPPPDPPFDMPAGGPRAPSSFGNFGGGIGGGAGPRPADSPFAYPSSQPARPGRAVGRRRGRSPSLAKDIGIGFGIAALVLGLFVGAKYLFFPSGDTPLPTGTITVAVTGTESGELLLDSQRIGAVQGGQSVTVQVGLGTHTVAIARGSTIVCEQPVTLDQSTPAAQVSCELRAPTGQLMLDGLTDEHVVTVDGTLVPASKHDQPLDLPANGKHEVAIKLGEQEVMRFDVALEPGQTLQRTVPTLEDIANEKAADEEAATGDGATDGGTPQNP